MKKKPKTGASTFPSDRKMVHMRRPIVRRGAEGWIDEGYFARDVVCANGDFDLEDFVGLGVDGAEFYEVVCLCACGLCRDGGEEGGGGVLV